MGLTWHKNMGTIERIIRIFMGLTLIGLAVSNTVTGWWAAAAIIIGLVQFVWAALAY